MKKFTALAILLSFIMVGFMACSKSSGSTTTNLDTGSKQAQSAMTINFTATQTGDGSITTLTYTVGSTTQTVSNPSLPWSKSVDASSGDYVSIKATAVTTNGSVTITYDGQNSTDHISGKDSVSTSSTK
ncbi:MAG: hypothetical protein JXR71_02480 [Bacteroidales bacterium]|nr:hypothetical protein [Bacteroidales bacterium]